MGKWGKYLKRYNKQWESDPVFKAWIQPSTEEAVNAGKGEAYCKLCATNLRAHKSDLLDHRRTKKHTTRENSLATTSRGRLDSFGTN
ncbi:hypothetical protein R5R35_001971 [Gryllus longicercus]|uniref:Uncharacterized protein n=1 Tax=Gryllus longicercus TaxID=2509291 RepID=A0AAN9V9C3_9ORTH